MIAASLAALLVGMWIANQGGLVAAPVVDDDGRTFALSPIQAFIATLWPLLLALPWVLAMWIAAAGMGRWLRALVGDGLPTSAVIIGGGFALLLIVDWLVATAGLMHFAAPLICILGAAGLVRPLLAELRKPPGDRARLPDLPWPIVFAMPAVGMLLVACSLPPSTIWAVEAFGYDVLSYHLQLPAEWLGDVGAMRGLEHNVYSFLPNLVEAGYMQLAAMRGGVYEAIYATQLLHASVAIAAATQIGLLVRRHTGDFAACIAAAAFLATPWTLITGSMAYNEMFAMLFGVCALRLATETRGHDWRSAACIGLLLGAATMAKLTAAAMLAAPVVGIMLLHRRDSQSADDRPAQRVRRACIAVAVAAAVLSPYLVRNAVQTGNPVFPFAANLLGRGHWTAAQVERWNAAHHVDASWTEAVRDLGYQWLNNTGYGAIAGHARQRDAATVEATNVARFHREWAWPTLWLVAGIGFVVALRRAPLRQPAALMLVMLLIQLIFWLTATHLQSRFLIFTLLPGCWLTGVAVGRLQFLGRILGAVLVLALTMVSMDVLWHQTFSQQPPWYWADALTDKRQPAPAADFAAIGDHPINR